MYGASATDLVVAAGDQEDLKANGCKDPPGRLALKFERLISPALRLYGSQDLLDRNTDRR